MNKHWNPLSPPHAPGVADCLPASSLCGKNPTRRFSSCPCRGQWGELVAESLTIINSNIKLLYLIIIMLEMMKRKILNSSSRLGQLQCSWWSGLVEEALWVLFLLSVHRNIISYQKTVACTFVQVTAGSQAKIDLAIKLGADKGVIIIIIIINTFTSSSSLLPPTPSSTAVSSCKGVPF